MHSFSSTSEWHRLLFRDRGWGNGRQGLVPRLVAIGWATREWVHDWLVSKWEQNAALTWALQWLTRESFCFASAAVVGTRWYYNWANMDRRCDAKTAQVRICSKLCGFGQPKHSKVLAWRPNRIYPVYRLSSMHMSISLSGTVWPKVALVPKKHINHHQQHMSISAWALDSSFFITLSAWEGRLRKAWIADILGWWDVVWRTCLLWTLN